MFETQLERVRVVDARPFSPEFRPMSGLSQGIPHYSAANLDNEQEASSGLVAEKDLLAEAFESGFKEAEAKFEAERKELQNLIASAQALQPEPSDELAVLIAETVAGLVSKIVGDAPIDGKWLVERARSAAALVGECDKARTLFIHPEDMICLKGAELPLAVETDPNAPRGSIRIDCSAGWIESGTALYLDALRVELGLQESLA